MEPELVAEGTLRGRRARLDAYGVLDEVVVVRTVWWGEPGMETPVREVMRVDVARAPCVMFMGMDVRAGWMREVVATAPVGTDLRSVDVDWDVRAGGERALSVLHGPRDVWTVRAGERVPVKWCQLEGEGLLAVFREPDQGLLTVGPCDGWTLYLRLLEAWTAG